MKKQEVLELLLSRGWQAVGDPLHSEGGVYQQYVLKKQSVWVGNHFIENERSPFALDYKSSSPDDLLRFLDGDFYV
jgi:hypothetical protein